MLIDFNLKDEGPIHQIMKKYIWYKIKHSESGIVFTDVNWGYKTLELKKCDAYMEREIYLNGEKIIPDILILNSNGKPKTVIEYIETSRPSFKKYQCYINSNIDVIFVDNKTSLGSLEYGRVEPKIMITENMHFNDRFKILFNDFVKLQDEFKFIGKFEDNDTYFIFNIDDKNNIRFMNSTVYSYGEFSKKNSKKIPIFLKQYLEIFSRDKKSFIKKFPKSVSSHEYNKGIRKYEDKKINYWNIYQ
tara:strand:+ start:270 stop:1007 length:738 start_codon:yes stop_codon:yes gene_type:complete